MAYSRVCSTFYRFALVIVFAQLGTNLFSFLIHSEYAFFSDTQQPGNQFILPFHFLLSVKRTTMIRLSLNAAFTNNNVKWIIFFIFFTVQSSWSTNKFYMTLYFYQSILSDAWLAQDDPQISDIIGIKKCWFLSTEENQRSRKKTVLASSRTTKTQAHLCSVQKSSPLGLYLCIYLFIIYLFCICIYLIFTPFLLVLQTFF